MRRVQVAFGKKLSTADREKWKNQTGFSLIPTGLTPVGLMISAGTIQSETRMKRLPSWFFQGAQASRLCCLVVTGGTPVPPGQALNRSPIGRAALSVNPDISCLA